MNIALVWHASLSFVSKFTNIILCAAQSIVSNESPGPDPSCVEMKDLPLGPCWECELMALVKVTYSSRKGDV